MYCPLQECVLFDIQSALIFINVILYPLPFKKIVFGVFCNEAGPWLLYRVQFDSSDIKFLYIMLVRIYSLKSIIF